MPSARAAFVRIVAEELLRASWRSGRLSRPISRNPSDGQADDLLVVEAEHVDEDAGQLDVPPGNDLADLAHELGDGLRPDDPLGVLDGLEEMVDDPVVAELADRGDGRPADVREGRTKDLGFDQLLDGFRT